MSLDACVSAVASELDISESDAREIADRIDAFRKRQGAQGQLDRVEAQVRAFAKDEAEKARIAAALKRKQAALNVLIRDAVDKHLDAQVGKGVPVTDAIVNFLVGGVQDRQSVSARRMALEGDWLRGMLAEAEQASPVVYDMLNRRPKEAAPFFADVVREMYELRQGGQPGRTGNKDARELAGIFARHAEGSRLEANKAGANIGRLDGWAGPQAYDDRRLLKAGQARFVERVTAELDAKRSFPGMSPDEVRGAVGESFLNIVTGQDRAASGAEKGERLGPSNIANSLAAHRVWHFKDADAWLRIHDEFGRGNIATAMLDHLHGMARKVSLMQTLGPNPETMLRSVLANRARRERLTAAGREQEAGRIAADLELKPGFYSGTQIGKAWAVVSGQANVPSNVGRARFFANARSVLTMAKLGGSLLSQFSDLATYAAAMHDQGRGLFQGQADALKGLVAGGGREAHLRAMGLGVAGDSLIGDIHTRFGADEGPVGRMAAAQAAFFKWSGVRWWTERMETAFANTTSWWMAEQAKLAHGALGEAYQHVLALHGIGAERWEIVRQAVEKADDGRSYVMPERLRELDDAAFHPLVADAMQEAEDALRERIGAQSQARRQAAVTRQGNRLTRAEGRLKEAQDRLGAAQASGDRRGLYNYGRAVEARQRALEAAQRAHGQASARLAAGKEAPVRELTEAEIKGLDERRTRLIATSRRELELDLRGFFADEAAYGVLKADDRTRMFVTQGTQPGSTLGEVFRAVSQFQSFSVAYGQRRLERSLRGYAGAAPGANAWMQRLARGPVQNAPAIATLIAATTVYGFLSMAAKDILKNRTTKSLRRPETWMAAAVQGGGVGLYGDFLFGQYDRFGGGLVGRLAGPMVGEVSNLYDLFQKARAGDPKAGDLIHFALNNTPFINLFYLRAALDLAVLNQLQEWASPGTLARRQRTVLQQFGQQYLVNPTPFKRPAPGVRPGALAGVMP
jgi:hypothetical protein